MTENDKKTKDSRMEAFWVYLSAFHLIWAEMFRKLAIQFSLEIQRFSLSIELFSAMANVIIGRTLLHFPTPQGKNISSDGIHLSLAVIWFLLVYIPCKT